MATMALERIPARHPVRNAFAGKSSGPTYYATKGHAVEAFDNALQAFDLHFDPNDCDGLADSDGWKTLRVCNEFDHGIGYARLSWHRMELSGRYEFTG